MATMARRQLSGIGEEVRQWCKGAVKSLPNRMRCAMVVAVRRSLSDSGESVIRWDGMGVAEGDTERDQKG